MDEMNYYLAQDEIKQLKARLHELENWNKCSEILPSEKGTYWVFNNIPINKDTPQKAIHRLFFHPDFGWSYRNFADKDGKYTKHAYEFFGRQSPNLNNSITHWRVSLPVPNDK